jgi:hypothetical protein
MKYFALIILIIFTSSCSKNEDNPSANNNLILLKKSISTSSTGNPRTTDYVYDRNKIVSATTNTFKTNYFYTNDLITKIEFTYNQIVSNRLILTYDNSQKLIEKTATSDSQQIVKEVFQYNSDGTISSTATVTNQDGEPIIETSKYFLGNNGEIVKREFYQNNGTQITTYQCDNKNNLFKNVLNFKKLLQFDSGLYNCTGYQSSLNGVVSSSSSSQFTYNSNDFPITNTTTNVNGSSTNTFTIQHFYE